MCSAIPYTVGSVLGDQHRCTGQLVPAAYGTQEVDGVWGWVGGGIGELAALRGPQEDKRRQRLLWKAREMGHRSLGNSTLFHCSKSNLNMKDLQFLSEVSF